MRSTYFDEDVEIRMRDGVILRADVLRPLDKERHLAIFTRSLRSKSVSWTNNFLNTQDAITAGYAVVISDVRGRHSSGGDWSAKTYATNIEGIDGYDTVEWIAGQEWCDGNVGMFGYSHAAVYTWQTAIENPPHLKAIATWSGGEDYGRGGEIYSGGAIPLNVSLNWIPNEAPDMVDKLEKSGQDVSEMRRILKWMTTSPEEFYNYLPLHEVIPAKYKQLKELWDMRLHRSPASQTKKTGERFRKITIPVSHEAGWYDPKVCSQFDSFNALREKGGSSLSRENQHMLVGPWPHSAYLSNWLGDVCFGTNATLPFGQSLPSQYMITFFDKYLQEKDIKIPVIKYFVMGRNQWREAEQWPLPKTQWQRYYLHSKGNANTSSGDGALNREQPCSEFPDVFLYDPLKPIPTMGGSVLGMIDGAGIMPGPLEQASIERRNDVLSYTSAELQEDIEVTGPIQVHLFAATSACNSDFAAKLIDVYPDGKAYNVVDGLMRASGLKGEGIFELVKPGEIYEYVITMGQTSQLFRKNHRIRVDVSSSNFPRFDRNMNTGNPIGEDKTGIIAVQTVYHQIEFASYVDLPIIPQ